MRRRRKQSRFAIRVRIALVRRGITVSDLARRIGRPRSSVSMAIHTPRFPRIRRAIRQALRL